MSASDIHHRIVELLQRMSKYNLNIKKDLKKYQTDKAELEKLREQLN